MILLHILRASSSHLSRRRSSILAAARALSTTRIVNAEVHSQSAGASASTSSSSDGTEKFSFQAETNQLLSIVTNSLYTDRQVFIR